MTRVIDLSTGRTNFLQASSYLAQQQGKKFNVPKTGTANYKKVKKMVDENKLGAPKQRTVKVMMDKNKIYELKQGDKTLRKVKCSCPN